MVTKTGFVGKDLRLFVSFSMNGKFWFYPKHGYPNSIFFSTTAYIKSTFYTNNTHVLASYIRFQSGSDYHSTPDPPCLQFEVFGCAISAPLDLACYIPVKLYKNQEFYINFGSQTFIRTSSSVEDMLVKHQLNIQWSNSKDYNLIWAAKFSSLRTCPSTNRWLIENVTLYQTNKNHSIKGKIFQFIFTLYNRTLLCNVCY